MAAGVWKRLPYLGRLSLLGVLLCPGFNIAILVTSNGAEQSWYAQPSVLLAVSAVNCLQETLDWDFGSAHQTKDRQLTNNASTKEIVKMEDVERTMFQTICMRRMIESAALGEVVLTSSPSVSLLYTKTQSYELRCDQRRLYHLRFFRSALISIQFVVTMLGIGTIMAGLTGALSFNLLSRRAEPSALNSTTLPLQVDAHHHFVPDFFRKASAKPTSPSPPQAIFTRYGQDNHYLGHPAFREFWISRSRRRGRLWI
ncbi:uncharacterized protein BP01DRAFT_384351 [Aspergillus saccharolyticus JOP 1030-1]|uniref:Transmembrane protein n=1 Tax=Aspergillus saccharolyticus JOP 1030-1 TaxID=1450539 RepID=A0A318ZUD5_9EURO|nr:hypothetical protein BP01DRAFT_384351 [Aspergillus saccharolyticus JOP 1030-1]PYH43698.1 hypothetical protein BP01DRAFT_384351 [Aspergillus saccharolyticus JOP 1030-1]